MSGKRARRMRSTVGHFAPPNELAGRIDIEKLVRAEVEKLVPSTQQGNRSMVPQKTYGLIDAMNAASGQHNFGAYAVPFERNPADDNAFGPGKPLDADPLDAPDPATGQPVPRTWQYPVSWNLPGNGNREVPWQVLRVASTAVDIIRRCIEYRKRTLRGMKPRWVVTAEAIQEAYESSPDAGREDAEKTLRAKYAPVIKTLTAFWRNPWEQNGLEFGQWVNMVMEEYLVLDAVAIYPRRNLNGDVMDFQVLDGSTIKPLLDVYGCRPADPYAAFQQVLYGFPRGEYGAAMEVVDGKPQPKPGLPSSRLFYHRENVRANSPYGLSAVEQALIAARLYLKRQGWMLAEYEDGSTPVTWIMPSEDESQKSGQAFTPEIRRAWEDGLNNELGGVTRRRQRGKVLPPGWTALQTQSVDERYKPDYDLHLIKLLCGFFDVPITELGFSEAKGIGNSGLHEGMADVAAKVGDRPTTEVISGIITGLARKFQNCPPEVELQFVDATATEQSTDEATADDLAFKGAQKTLNDVRRAKGLPVYSFPEADMALLVGVGPTGVIFLEGLYDQQQVDRQMGLAAQQSQIEGNLQTGGAQPPGDQGAGGQDAQKAARIGDELAAFNRWRRRNPNAARPFVFKAAEPDDVDRLFELDPNTMAFEGWEWQPDLEKGAGWDPGVKRFRDARGRFIRGGGLGNLDDALDEAIRELHAGRKVRMGTNSKFDRLHQAGLLEEMPDRRGQLQLSDKGRDHIIARSPGDYAEQTAQRAEAVTPSTQAREAETQMERGAREMAVAEAASEVHELIENGADMDVIRRRARGTANRHTGTRHADELSSFADEINTANDQEEAAAIAHGFAQHHGLSQVGKAGEVLPYDPHLHRGLPGERHGKGDRVQVVAPGFTSEHDDPLARHIYGSNTVPVKHAVVAEPFEGPEAPKVETPREKLDRISRGEFTDAERAEQARIQRDLDAAQKPEAPRPAHGRSPDRTGPRTPEEVQARRDRLEAQRKAEVAATGVDATQREIVADLEGRRADAAFEAATSVPESAPSIEDARGASLHDKLRRAEVMYGTDRSKWPAAARAEETKIKMRAAAEERRRERTRAVDTQQAQHRELSTGLDESSTVQDMTPSTPSKPVRLTRAQGEYLAAMAEGRNPRTTHGTRDALESRGLIEPGPWTADAYGHQTRGRVVTELGRASLEAHNAKQTAGAPDTSMPQGTGAGDGTPAPAAPFAPEYKPVKLTANQADALRLAYDRDGGYVIGRKPTVDKLEQHGFVERRNGVARITPLGRQQHEATTGHRAMANDEAGPKHDMRPQTRALRAEAARQEAAASAPAAPEMPAKPSFAEQQRELAEELERNTRRQMDLDIAEHERLTARAEELDTEINLAEADGNDYQVLQLMSERARIDTQQASLDRQISAARRELAKKRREPVREPAAAQGAPSAAPAVDLWQKRDEERQYLYARDPLATDPNNIQPGQVIWTGSKWARVTRGPGTTAKSRNQIQIHEAGELYKREYSLSLAQEAIRRDQAERARRAGH